MIKITKERTIIIKESTKRGIDFEYEIWEDGRRLFGWNNPNLPINYLTKVLFSKQDTTMINQQVT